jgi:nucleotide-binding universal stress UspA family protein
MTEAARPVVVGVDGSPDALDAVRAGAREAHRRGAPLELVLAFPWPEGARVPAPPGFDGRAVLRTMAELALESAAGAAAEVGPGEVRSRIVDGRAVDVLAAASASASLLCLGSQGTGALRELLLGSTAAALVPAAACPVLLVPRHAGTSVQEPRGVVVGLAGEPGDGDLVGTAFAAADSRDVELVAVHAWRHRGLGPEHALADPLVGEADARRREEHCLEEAIDGWPDRYPAVPVRRVVERARPAAALLAVATTAELLVVGNRRRRALERLGTVTHAVVHRSVCPVLVVPLEGRRLHPS